MFDALPLDSQDWNRLRHAYGSASDIPGLLRQLARASQPSSGPNHEPWYSLWSSLCHQDNVYEASYAALPHIVAIAIETAGPVDFSFFLLPASIDISRARGRGPVVPDFLAAGYKAGLQGLHDCAFRHRGEAWDDTMAQSVTCALAAAKGRYDVAEAISLLDSAIIARVIALDL
jgi:hypothetical protein